MAIKGSCSFGVAKFKLYESSIDSPVRLFLISHMVAMGINYFQIG
jgi:hypothetical protein